MNLTFAGHRVDRLTEVACLCDVQNVYVTGVEVNLNVSDLSRETECRGVTDVTALLDTLSSWRCELSGSDERTVSRDVLIYYFVPVNVLSLLS